MEINIVRDDGLASDFAAKVQEFINHLESLGYKIIDIKYVAYPERIMQDTEVFEDDDFIYSNRIEEAIREAMIMYEEEG